MFASARCVPFNIHPTTRPTRAHFFGQDRVPHDECYDVSWAVPKLFTPPMLESPADDQWERLLTKLRRGPCGIVKQGPFLASSVLSARRGSMSIANSRQLRWWALAVIPLFVLYAYLDYWQRGDLLAFRNPATVRSPVLRTIQRGGADLREFYSRHWPLNPARWRRRACRWRTWPACKSAYWTTTNA